MEDINHRYYQIPLDDVVSRPTIDSRPIASRTWFKASVVLIGVSCIVLLSMLALSTSAAEHQRADILRSRSAAGSINLGLFDSQPTPDPSIPLPDVEDPKELLPVGPVQHVLGEQCSPADLMMASEDLSGMNVGDIATIQRSDKKWRYARLQQRSDTEMTFAVDLTRSSKVFDSDDWTQVKALPQQRWVLGETCSEEDMEHASADISGITPGDLAAVLRSDGSWRYARLLKRDEKEMTFVVGAYSVKEFPKDGWDEVKVLSQQVGPHNSWQNWETRLLSPLLLTKQGLQPTSEVIGGRTVVLLYYSSPFCAACRSIMPKLIRAYKGLGKEREQNFFGVVLINSDKSRKFYDKYYRDQPWAAMPFYEERPKKGQPLSWYYQSLGWYYKQLVDVLEIKKQPTMIALDGRTGNVIDPKARDTLYTYNYNISECLRLWGYSDAARKAEDSIRAARAAATEEDDAEGVSAVDAAPPRNKWDAAALPGLWPSPVGLGTAVPQQGLSTAQRMSMMRPQMANGLRVTPAQRGFPSFRIAMNRPVRAGPR